VAGFGGLRDFDGEVRFAPRLPAGWTRLRFRVEVRGQRIEVDMRPAATTYRLLEGDGLMIEHCGEPVRLRPGVSVLMPALAPHEVEEAREPDVAA
jgi:alpha,alpha-trehalose phosphorylase